jgi:transposase-like protein
VKTNLNNSVSKKFDPFKSEEQLAEYLQTNAFESLKQAIRTTVKIMIRNEMEVIRTEIDDRINFNGSYQRNMLSQFGKIEGIEVPRFRQNPAGLDLNSVKVFDSEKDRFEKLIAEMHINGISQRKIKRIAQICFGTNISTARVGKVHKELADQEAFRINSQILDDNFEYLLLDGIWQKTKGFGWDKNEATLLCALGIRPDGERKVIAFSFARSESYEEWYELVSQLKKRGLLGKNLKLVISDDNGGIKKARNQLFPSVPFQICIAHKMRNVISKTSPKNKAPLADDLKYIFKAETKENAMIRAKEFVKKWYVMEEKAMTSFKFNIEDCFTYLQFPKEIWSRIRTSNILEREFREVRRRTKVFDNSFNDAESCERYANTIFTNLNNYYPAKH